MHNRIKIAIEFLKDYQSFSVGNLRLSINELGDIEVTGWSQYTSLHNLTKIKALEELEQIKSLFTEMLSASSELIKFIEGRSIKYNLWFDDYGKASITICSERNNIVHWEINLEDSF